MNTPNPSSVRRDSRPTLQILLLVFPFWLSACRDNSISQYRIPKEGDVAPVAAVQPAEPQAFVVAKTAPGELVWTAPAQWRAKQVSSMRKGSYDIGDAGGPVADLAITAFPGDVGGDLANVNRWRGQIDLPPITAAELPGVVTPIEANGLRMLLVDITGGSGDKAQRMLGAILPRDGYTWFFKLTGPAAVVGQARPDYLAFLQSVRAGAPAGATPVPAPSAVAAAPSAGMASTPVPTAAGAGLKWTAPATWESKPATAMRKATYVITEAGGATAELAVTAFPGDVGGELANVNRWRGQLQLPPIAESELAGAVTHVTVNGLTVTLVELAGGTADQSVRLLGAMVPSNGSTWFFKLTGPAAVVAKEKPAFLALVQTLNAS
jgi:hypothetical protein